MTSETKAVCGGGEATRQFNSFELTRICRERADMPEELSKLTLRRAADRIEELEAALASTAGAGPGTTAQHLRDALAPHASQDGTWFSFGLSDLEDVSKRLRAGAGAGDLPTDLQEAIQKLDAIREEEHRSLRDGDGIRLYRIAPALSRAEELSLEYVRSLLSAVPASPRSGTGEDSALLDMIASHGLAVIPQANGGWVIEGDDGSGEQEVEIVRTRERLRSALREAARTLVWGLPDSPTAPAEHGAEIRDLLAQFRDENDRALACQKRSAIAKSPDFAAYHGGRAEAYQHAARMVSALSQGGGAGRSERAVEIRELSEKATTEPPCHWGGGNDIIWCSTCGAEYAYAKGEERPPCPRSPAPAQSPSTSDREG